MTTAIEEKTIAYESAYCTGPGSTHTGDDAIRWCQDVLHSVFWSTQKEIIRSVYEHRQTVVRSCNASGKTFVVSDIAIDFLVNMSPCIVVTTAPTFTQVRDVLWAEIRAKWNEYLYEPTGVECLQTRLEIAPGYFMVGLSPDKGVNFQGFHQVNVLVLFDEAPGVKPDIVRGAKTLMAGGKVRTLWIGNPLEAEGHFFDAFHKGEWNRIHIHHRDTPNFIEEQIEDGKTPDPDDINLPQHIKDQLISRAWVGELRDEAGEDSPLFQSGANGDFPDSDSRTVISLKLATAAAEREVVAEGPIDMGIDCGGGGDLTVYTLKRGNIITEVITESTPDVMQIAYRAVQLHKEHNFRYINCDKGGLGHGPVDRMEELGLPVVGIYFGGKANETDRYANKRTEMALNLKKWLEYGKIPNDRKLIAELTAPRLLGKLTAEGQVQLEEKSETKKRLGHSPDRFDSAGLVVDQTSGRGLGLWVYNE